MTAAAARSRSTKVAWRGAARQGLDAGRPGAGEQVQDAGVAQVGLEDREQRLLDAVAERARAACRAPRAGCRGRSRR